MEQCIEFLAVLVQRFIRTVIDLLSVDLCIARRLHKFVQKYAVTYTWSSLFSF